MRLPTTQTPLPPSSRFLIPCPPLPMMEVMPRTISRWLPHSCLPHECWVPLNTGGPEQRSGVPLSTIPSLKKIPVWLRKAEDGILRLQATQVEEQPPEEASLGSLFCGRGVHDASLRS